jgi:ABC-type protease/lipase transport system fused ATPase/permease subunit
LLALYITYIMQIIIVDILLYIDLFCKVIRMLCAMRACQDAIHVSIFICMLYHQHFTFMLYIYTGIVIWLALAFLNDFLSLFDSSEHKQVKGTATVIIY